MYIDQTHSLGRTLNAINNKDVKLFLFNSVIPVGQDAIPFDPTNPLEVYNNCVAYEETTLIVDVNSGSMVLKANPSYIGSPYKGSGPDVALSGAMNWLIPTSLGTSLVADVDEQFDLTNILTLKGSSNRTLTPSNSYAAGDTVEFGFEYEVEVSGLAISPGSTGTQADFKIQYWDSALLSGAGDWVDHYSHTDKSSTEYRLDFDLVTTTKMRIEYTESGSGRPVIHYMRFYSTQTTPATNFSTVDPVGWAMMFLDLSGDSMGSVVNNASPYIWFPVGIPVAPNVVTLEKNTITSATLPKLIHAELIGDIVGDI